MDEEVQTEQFSHSSASTAAGNDQFAIRPGAAPAAGFYYDCQHSSPDPAPIMTHIIPTKRACPTATDSEMPVAAAASIQYYSQPELTEPNLSSDQVSQYLLRFPV